MHRVFSNLLWDKCETWYKSAVVTKHPFYVLRDALHEIENTRSYRKNNINLFPNAVFDATFMLPEEVCIFAETTSRVLGKNSGTNEGEYGSLYFSAKPEIVSYVNLSRDRDRKVFYGHNLHSNLVML